MKIALIDVHNEKYKTIWDVSGPIKEKYCAKHGYDCLKYKTRPLIPANRQDNWGRIQGILYHLKNYDWLFYLDTDLLLLNHDIKVEDYIDDKYNLIAGPLPHEGHIMTSGMLIKNCEWSFEFFLDLYAQTQFIQEPYFSAPGLNNATGTPCTGGSYFEQSAFHYLYDTEQKYFEKIKLVPRDWFNSEIGKYKSGDFLIHFPGQHTKLKLMNAMLQFGYDHVLSNGIRFDDPREIYKKIHNSYEKIRGRYKKLRSDEAN